MQQMEQRQRLLLLVVVQLQVERSWLGVARRYPSVAVGGEGRECSGEWRQVGSVAVMATMKRPQWARRGSSCPVPSGEPESE